MNKQIEDCSNIDIKRLEQVIDGFKGKKIGVIGDLILDHFIWGDAERLSPEAPVPVVLMSREELSPGGAGNVANNIASLGGKVFVAGVIGNDGAGRHLVSEFKKRKIEIGGVIKDSNRPTVQKIRIIARGQQIVRVDKEISDYVKKDFEEKIIQYVSKNIKDWDGLILSDYAKGFLTKKVVRKIIQLAKINKKIIVGDLKPKHALFFKNIDFITPNHKEATEISGISEVNKSGRRIQQKLKCDVLITRGAEGMTLFKGKQIAYFPTKAREVFDVSGAGDTVTASLVMALVSGASATEACIIANHAAGIVVGKAGTATVESGELKKWLCLN